MTVEACLKQSLHTISVCLDAGNWVNVVENVLSSRNISDNMAKNPACIEPRAINAGGCSIASDLLQLSVT